MAFYNIPGQNLSFKIPNEGEAFRLKDSTMGDIYLRQGNQLLSTNLENLGRSLFNPSTAPADAVSRAAGPSGQFINGPVSYMNLEPSQRQSLGIQALQQRGIDYNSIPLAEYNLADVNSAFDRLGGRGTLSDLSLLNRNPSSTGEVFNQIISQDNPQAAVVSSNLQGQINGMSYQPAPTSYNASSGGLSGQLQSFQGKRIPITLGNGQTIYADNQGNFFDSQGNSVSHQTVASSIPGNQSYISPYIGRGSPGGQSSFPTTNPSTGTPGVSSTESPYQAMLTALKGYLTPSTEETDIQNKISDLESRRKQGDLNISQQAIPEHFVTGQQAASDKYYQNEEQTLQQKLGILQSKRQAALDVAKAGMEYSKPVSVAPGSSLVNPSTGQELFSGIQGLSSKEAMDTAFNLLQNYPDIGIQYDPNKSPQENLKTIQRALPNSAKYDTSLYTQRVWVDANGQPHYYYAKGPGIGPMGRENQVGNKIPSTPAPTKADAASLKVQQEYADSTERAFNTANANLQQLVSYMNQSGVNKDSNIPIINALANKFKGQLVSPGIIAGYNAALAGLRAEYAQVLSRGGEVTEGQRAQASSLLPANLTPIQLKQVSDRLNLEGANAIKEAKAQVQTIKDRMGGITSSPNTGTTGQTSGGNTYTIKQK